MLGVPHRLSRPPVTPSEEAFPSDRIGTIRENNTSVQRVKHLWKFGDEILERRKILYLYLKKLCLHSEDAAGVFDLIQVSKCSPSTKSSVFLP